MPARIFGIFAALFISRRFPPVVTGGIMPT
jgi:hypothetical protein